MNRKLTLKEKAVVGVTVGVGVAAYVWHRKQVDELITAWQDIREDAVWTSFYSGVQYGIQLAQQLAAGELVSTEDIKEAAKNSGFAFTAFDKAA